MPDDTDLDARLKRIEFVVCGDGNGEKSLKHGYRELRADVASLKKQMWTAIVVANLLVSVFKLL